jgi:hypothetical protein
MSKKLTLAVPAILAVSVAAVSFGLTSGSAADGCLSAPKGTAPEGRHWYYRVDRANGRHCWYLGAKGMKVRQSSSRSSPRKRAAPAHKPDTPVKAREPDAPVKKSVAPPAPEPVTRSAEPAPRPAHHASALPNELPPTNAPVATRFSQFWPSLRAPIDIAQTAPANSNADANANANANANADANSNAGTHDAQQPASADAQAGMPASPVASVSPATPAVAAARPAAPVIRTEQMLAIMVGALSLAGLIMALTYKLASIRRPRDFAARGSTGANNARVQLQPFGHTGVLPRPATPIHKPVITKRGETAKRSEIAKRIADHDRESHEARRLRELRELREGLETRLEELRHARRRSAA